MSTATPHLEAQKRKKRQRSIRNLGLTGVLALVFVVALAYVLLNAGRWGVPMFSFKNEYGTKCKNGFLGHTCDPMTLADIEARSKVDLPDDTQVLIGRWNKTHDYEMSARVRFPQASAQVGRDALAKEFGECKPNIPNPLTQVEGVKDICTMTNVGRISTDGKAPDPRIWQVSMGFQADGSSVADLHIRSR